MRTGTKIVAAVLGLTAAGVAIAAYKDKVCRCKCCGCFECYGCCEECCDCCDFECCPKCCPEEEIEDFCENCKCKTDCNLEGVCKKEAFGEDK